MIEIIGDQGKRKSRYNPDLARIVNEEVRRERRQSELETRLKGEKTPQGSEQITREYILMPKTNTYALGVHALQKACVKENNQDHPFIEDNDAKIYRPLTFKENIEARVEHYENNKNSRERLRLFNRWLDSCTGIAYKPNTTKFKIIPVCNELVVIDKGFTEDYLLVNYDSIKVCGGIIELDSSHGKYNQLLSKDEVLQHPGWRAAVEDDIYLLKTYRDIVFNEFAKQYSDKDANKLMGFCVKQNTNDDELRPLLVHNIENLSTVVGTRYLPFGGKFLRVVQAKKSTGNKG